MAGIRQPPPVPTTSIYSRSDGIVSWRCSLNEPGPLAENIEVPASHIGMGMNPLALFAVADRLAQPIGHWQRFDASGARRWFFRTGWTQAAAAAGSRVRLDADRANGLSLEVEEHGPPRRAAAADHGPGHAAARLARGLGRAARRARLSRHPLRQPRRRPEPELRPAGVPNLASTRCVMPWAARSRARTRSPTWPPTASACSMRSASPAPTSAARRWAA